MADYPAIHGPSRPDWDCLVCGDPWPCLTRKRQLKELCHCNIRTLVRYMTSYLPHAHQEIDGLSTSEITERFLGWCDRPLEAWTVHERSAGSGSRDAHPTRRREDMDGTDDDPQSRSERAEAAEREAARQRLLEQAEADRIPVEETTRAIPDRRWRRGQR